MDLSKVEYWADVAIVEEEDGSELYDIVIIKLSSGEEVSSGVEESAALAQAWIEREVELLKSGDEDTVNADYWDRCPQRFETIH